MLSRWGNMACRILCRYFGRCGIGLLERRVNTIRRHVARGPDGSFVTLDAAMGRGRNIGESRHSFHVRNIVWATHHSLFSTCTR